MDDDKLVVFDVETSGLDPKKHEITQIAMAAMQGDDVVSRLEMKVQFDVARASDEALEIFGYTEERWSDAERPTVMVDQVAEFLRRNATIEKTSARTGRKYKIARVAGYNVSFDVKFLTTVFKAWGAFLPADAYRALDVMQLALWHDEMLGAVRGSYKLVDMAEAFGFRGYEAHDAYNDVEATIHVLSGLRRSIQKNLDR